MAITNETRMDIIELTVGMFNAAPGATVLAELTVPVEAGASIWDLAVSLAENPVFKGIYPNFLSESEFATKFLSNLLGGEPGEVSQANFDLAHDAVVALLNSGESRGSVAYQAITAVSAIAEDDANFGAAAARLNNQTEVAAHYSVTTLQSGDTLDELQGVIDDVTSSDATVTTAKAEVDSTDNQGQTFMLTTDIDEFTGGMGNDIFNAMPDAGTGTLTSFDALDGGAGTDTLNVTTIGAALDTTAITATIENIETANLKSDDAVTADTTSWTGLNYLNVLEGDAVDLTVSDDTAVDAKSTDSSTMEITGGSTVVANNDNTVAAASNIAVASGKATTEVTTVGGHLVTIGDGAVLAGTFTDDGEDDTITSVSIAENSGVAAVNSDALTSLALKDSDQNATVTAAIGTRTLGLTLDGYHSATVDDGEATTLNITSSGTGAGNDGDGGGTAAVVTAGKATAVSADVADADATIDLSANVAESLSVSGDSTLDLTATAIAALESVTVTGEAGLDSDLTNSAVLETVSLSGTTGDNTLTLDATVADLAVTGGSGADAITTAGALDADAVINLGAGDDTYTFDTAAAAGASVDGGDDQDTLGVANGALLDSNASDVYSNFEVLEIAGGTGTYNMSNLPGLTAVGLSGALTTAAATTAITNAVAGTTLDMTVSAASTDETLTGTAGGAGDPEALSFALADASGPSDSLSITLTARDGDDDETAEGQVTAGLTANDIENVTIESTVTGVDAEDGANDALSASDYTNVFTLDADSAESLNLTGDAVIDFDASAASTSLTQVDATDNTAGVEVDMSATANGVTFNGSAADDEYEASTGGDTVQANGGADAITLGTGSDTVRYVSVTDSQLTLTDTSDPADDVADTATGFDVITDFNTLGTDIIELSSSLGLATGDARSAVLQKGGIGGTTPAALESFIDDGVDFFDTGLVDRAVAFADDGTDGYIFVDVNGDGNFTQADDMVIQLAAQTAFQVTDIQFG